MCDHPRTPHLNPATAESCGWCHSTNLYEPAGSVLIPLSWIGPLLRVLALLCLARLAGPPLLGWAGSQLGGFLGISRYADWRVWAFETLGPPLLPLALPLVALSVLAGLLPGRAGRRARGLLTRVLSRAIRLLLEVLLAGIRLVTRLVLSGGGRGGGRDGMGRGGRNRTGF